MPAWRRGCGHAGPVVIRERRGLACLFPHPAEAAVDGMGGGDFRDYFDRMYRLALRVLDDPLAARTLSSWSGPEWIRPGMSSHARLAETFMSAVRLAENDRGRGPLPILMGR